jgi:hypothetical protein
MTTWTQLNPQLPLDTPYGPGFAIAIAQDSQNHESVYKVQLVKEGMIMDFQQSEVRVIGNRTFGISVCNSPPDIEPENDNSWELYTNSKVAEEEKFAVEKRLEEIMSDLAGSGRKSEKVKGKGAGAKRPRR